MPRRRRIGQATLSEIQQKARCGWSGPDILKHLEGPYQKGDVESVPALRTIQEIMREYEIPDPSGPWSVADAAAEHIPLILAVLETLVAATRGQRRYVTRREAELVIKISKALPDIRKWELLGWAHGYMWCEEKQMSSEVLDLALAIEPWRDDERADTYFACVGMPDRMSSAALPWDIIRALWKAKERQEATGQPGETIDEEIQA